MNDSPIVARGLGKFFGDRRGLDGLTFSVEPGDVIGVLGKNGAGKTTLLELILGFTPASAGAVALFAMYALSVTTSRSAGTAMEFAFKLVELLAGPDKVKEVNAGVLARL